MEVKTKLSELEFSKNLRNEDTAFLSKLSKQERIDFFIAEDEKMLQTAKKLGLKTITTKKAVSNGEL